MVLSLVDICCVSLRNAVESGTFPYVYLLPPKLRQSILDMVFMHGTANDPKCVQILGSVQFLRKLSSLDTQKGELNSDSRYLDRVAQSMATVLPTGETIGSGIEKLSLNLYGNYYFGHFSHGYAANFSSAVRLIAQCPNLASLHLRFVARWCGSPPEEESDNKRVTIFHNDSTGGGLLNEIEVLRPCLSIVENLRELSLEGTHGLAPLLVNGRQIIEFKKLTVLHLECCVLHADAWRQLLQCVQGTLTELCAKCLRLLPRRGDAYDGQVLLPFPLPHLETFKLEEFGDKFEYSHGFVQNLSQCQQLNYALLELNKRTTDEQLAALSSIKATFDIDLRFSAWRDEKSKSDRLFALVHFFHSKVKHLHVQPEIWTPEGSTAFKRALDMCSNLTVLELWMPSGVEGEMERRELEQAKRHLGSLFSDRERALKLKKLKLTGAFDYDVLRSLFENCLRLDLLVIQGCPQLNNDHLIEWANHGAKPRMLGIGDCWNVTDDGLIPVLISSGCRLIKFAVSSSRVGQTQITSRTWRVMIDHCPYAKVKVSVVSDELAELWRSKRFCSY